MNRPKKLDLKNLISWGGSKNPAFFDFTGNFVEFSCKLKKPSGQDRTAADGNYVAEATRRRRRILLAGFFPVPRQQFYKNILHR